MSRKKKNSNGSGGSLENLEKSTNQEKVEKKSSLKKRVVITAKTDNQKLLLKSIKDNIITIVYGNAGSGKTRISVLQGLKDFASGKYKKLLFTRPCVEANGENLGFLPGDLNEKIHPYMIPIFDFLLEYMDSKEIQHCIEENKIMTLPLAFQRGCTFTDSYVLLDECQNTSIQQVRMFLTRIGENCKIVLTGDIDQTDIRGVNGLSDVISRIDGVSGVGIVKFTERDVQRHPIVVEIEKKYIDS
ncbi:MAG: PhoH family protein [Clostridiales bacterium]|nr:PhoH family protein [Clostridiales bacterium]